MPPLKPPPVQRLRARIPPTPPPPVNQLPAKKVPPTSPPPINQRHAKIAVYSTIGLCTVTSLYSWSGRRYMMMQDHFVCSRRNLAECRYFSLIGSILNHGGGLHLLGNMFGLWSFGTAFASSLGARTFLAVFFGGGLLGNAACLGLDARPVDNKGDFAEQKKNAGRFIGASGGVCAVMAAYACWNPVASFVISVDFLPVIVPPLWVVAGYAAFSVFAQATEIERNTAHLGHLGGLLYGGLWFVTKFRTLPVV